jgi:hypothetical protein
MMILCNFQNRLLALVGVLALVGCSSSPLRQEAVVTVTPRYAENVPIPKVQPVELNDLSFKLMNKETMRIFLESKIGDDFTIYTLDDQNVAILIGNIQELRRYIQSQQQVIVYLKKILDARTEKGEK